MTTSHDSIVLELYFQKPPSIAKFLEGQIIHSDRPFRLHPKNLTIALAGNPNSGKTTLFNNSGCLSALPTAE